MNFKIKKNILLESLNDVSKALSSRNIIPILDGIKFELKEEGLYLLCSNDDITIKSFIKEDLINKINNLGSIVIPGRYILEIIRKISNEIINIETDGSKMLITTNTSEYNLNAMNASEYPDRDLNINNKPIIIKQKVFKNIINQTSFAISNQESRPILTGINIKIEGNIFEATATDSYRLAKKKVILNKKIENKIDIVVPGHNLIELVKLLNQDDEDIEIHIFDNRILFKFKNILFQSRLLNGTYPNVDNLISLTSKLTIEVKRQELYDVIDRASIFSEKDKSIVKLNTSDDEIIIISDSEELGKIEERIKLKEKLKEKIKIAFNSKYMLDALRSLNVEEVILLINEEIKPIIIKEKDDDNLIQLILPVKTY